MQNHENININVMFVCSYVKALPMLGGLFLISGFMPIMIMSLDLRIVLKQKTVLCFHWMSFFTEIEIKR